MLEKQKEAHEMVLNEVHAELKSIKNLLSARQHPTESLLPKVSIPTIPAWQMNQKVENESNQASLLINKDNQSYSFVL